MPSVAEGTIFAVFMTSHSGKNCFATANVNYWTGLCQAFISYRHDMQGDIAKIFRYNVAPKTKICALNAQPWLEQRCMDPTTTCHALIWPGFGGKFLAAFQSILLVASLFCSVFC